MNRIYLIIGLTILSACGVSNKKKNQEVVATTTDLSNPPAEVISVPEPEKVKPKTYRATETVYTDLIHTSLAVNFDWNKAWMNGVATITAKPHFYATDSLFLDAKGMEIKKVSLGNTPLNFKYDGASLRIKLNKVYTKADKYTIVIDYIAKPNERTTAGSEAIKSDKGLYFINPKGDDKTKMPQIWTQGETEASSVWFPTIDAPNVKTTQEIYITVDQKYATLSNGKMISSTKNANGTRTDYWKQDLPHAPYLFMMGVGEFKVVKDFYTRPNGTKMEVNYYVEPEWEPYAKAIFGETPKMIKFFSELTGVEYPWDKYHQIVVREYVSGAMENTGAVVFGDYAYKTDRELLDDNDNSTIAHELFHHWFGDLVTAESWSNLTLNESFANYSQYLWDEHRHGIDEADYNAEKEADGYYQSGLTGGFHDLVWFDYDSQEQMFDGHSYNKGGRILHMLRNHLGDEAFFAGLKNYLNANKFKAAEFHQLRLAFEEVSGQDLNWFFNQWYTASGHPELEINQQFSAENKTVTLKVSQTQDLSLYPLFKLPVEIAVYDDAGVHLHKGVIDQQEGEFTFPVSGTLKTVIFDNQQMLLAKIKNDKPQEQYIQQYYLGKRYADRRDALAFGAAKATPEAQKLILDALNDPFWYIRSLAILQADMLTAENKTKATAIIEKLAVSDSNSTVRMTTIDYLSETMSSDNFEKLVTGMIAKDRSYLVLGTALTALSKSNATLAMTEAKKLEKEPSAKMKSGIAQLYATQGGEKELPFFEDLINSNKLTGIDVIYGLNSVTIYMSRQTPEIQQKAVKLYEVLHANGGIYAQMFMSQNAAYLVSAVKDQMRKTNAEIEAFDMNKEPAYADKARKKLKLQQTIIQDLETFQKKIDAEGGNKAH